MPYSMSQFLWKFGLNVGINFIAACAKSSKFLGQTNQHWQRLSFIDSMGLSHN